MSALMSTKKAAGIHPLLAERRSPRAFSDRIVEPEKLRSLMDAARWAPSSFNEQPWIFIVTTREDPESYERLLSTLVEGNVHWARRAPVLMLSVARLNFSHNGKPNRHALHDVGAAVANLTLQATALGLWVHQMAGFSVEKARQLFAIPEGYEPVAAIAVGYLGEADLLPEVLRERERAPRARRALREFVFAERWAMPASFLEGGEQ